MTVNVEIYPAIDTGSDISFRQIHKPTGQRVRYQKTVPGVGEIDSSDIVKGYEINDDTYVLIEPDEIKALQLESERSLDLVQFIDASEIDARYFERPYYVLPADKPSTDGYRVIAAALAEAGKGRARRQIDGSCGCGPSASSGSTCAPSCLRSYALAVDLWRACLLYSWVNSCPEVRFNTSIIRTALPAASLASQT